MGNLTASYRIAYFQPIPEDGDRVAVALLVTEGNDVELLYDPAFPKLRCLAPHFDPDIVRFQLEFLDAQLRERVTEPNIILKSQAPHLVLSEQRKVTSPLTNRLRTHLIHRFLAKEGYVSTAEVERAAKVDLVEEHLVRVLREIAPRAELRERAKSDFVLGQTVKRLRPVAVALRKPDEIVIVDGVDLNVMKPRDAATRAGKVAFTFFQYARAHRQLDFARRSLTRVGVVLNGTTKPVTAGYRDAHDFAMQEFQEGADVAIDAGTSDGIAKLTEVITST